MIRQGVVRKRLNIRITNESSIQSRKSRRASVSLVSSQLFLAVDRVIFGRVRHESGIRDD